jgi:hypothetical protein
MRRLLLPKLLLQPLLLLFLGQVMPDGAAGHCPHHGMMASHMPRHGTDGSTLEATPRRSIG